MAMSLIATKSAVLVGCARNCEPYLDRVLANMALVASQFAEAAFVFVENDSADATAAHLQAFGGDQAHFILEQLPGLAQRHRGRTERLAAARNHYLKLIRGSRLRGFDYLLVFDMDEVNAAGQPPDNFLRAIEFLESAPDHAAVFANQAGCYYDMWALRHAGACPGDVWEEVFDYALAHAVSDQAAFDATFAKRIFKLGRDSAPVEVDSAFGGLGIYRMASVLEGEYIGRRDKAVVVAGRTHHLLWQVCEHVSFHAAIRARGGRLFIAPWLLNAQCTANFPPSAFRGLYRVLEAPP